VSAGRHPFKATPRDTRAHKLIEWYLGEYGTDSQHEHTVKIRAHDNANEARLSVRRGASHYGVSAAAWVCRDGEQCAGDCPDPDAVHDLTFSLHSKGEARRHVARQAGGNSGNLKYNPFAKRG